MSMLFKYGRKKGAAFFCGSINLIPFKGRHVKIKSCPIKYKKFVNNKCHKLLMRK